MSDNSGMVRCLGDFSQSIADNITGRPPKSSHRRVQPLTETLLASETRSRLDIKSLLFLRCTAIDLISRGNATVPRQARLTCKHLVGLWAMEWFIQTCSTLFCGRSPWSFLEDHTNRALLASAPQV
jgi:hypothetical protein